MSIIINNLSYQHADKQSLFSNITFTVNAQAKASLIGNNGTGKSTLMQIIAGKLQPSGGTVVCSSASYYIPQHIGLLHRNIAEALQVDGKLAALDAITKGSTNPSDFDVLGDDWDIEQRVRQALDYWGLHVSLFDYPVDELSGGEKTKVFLAGLLIHQPAIILLDEPTNHLDTAARERLYEYIAHSKATILVVSHDIVLLDQLDTTYELSGHGVKLYGGNYSFYEEQKAIEANALSEDINAEEKALRLARKKAREVAMRQEKRNRQGEKNKDQVIRILRKTKLNAGENTAAKLKDKHTEILGEHKEKLTELRAKKDNASDLKIDFDDARLHKGKQLVVADKVNFGYTAERKLWQEPVSLELLSGDRLLIKGNNGSGKTTLIRLLLGELEPTEGTIKRADFKFVYLDQNYGKLDENATILQLADQFNHDNLEEHEVKIRLNRFLFPPDTWDKQYGKLSGGEKLRINLCCLMISNRTPDIFVLDEPSNNLDIRSLKILIQTIKNYRGTVLVISHDAYFVNEIGVDNELVIG